METAKFCATGVKVGRHHRCRQGRWRGGGVRVSEGKEGEGATEERLHNFN